VGSPRFGQLRADRPEGVIGRRSHLLGDRHMDTRSQT
jgi:hypothetical protein